MAQATKETFEVEIKRVETIKGVVLKLSIEEAQILRRLVGSIYGKGTCRNACNEIYKALEEEGIEYDHLPAVTATHFHGE